MNKKQIQSRRERVLALYSAGLNQDSIAEDMKISRNHINGQTQNYLQEQLPFEQQICITGINRVIRMAWEIAWKSFGRDINPMNKLRILSKSGYPPSVFEDMDSGHKVALQAMKLAKDCYQIKMNLINGRITVDKAVKFIQSRKVKSIEADTGAEVINTSISSQTLHKREEKQLVS